MLIVFFYQVFLKEEKRGAVAPVGEPEETKERMANWV
jgi:hypothetical protein